METPPLVSVWEICASDKRVVTSHLHTWNVMLKWKFFNGRVFLALRKRDSSVNLVSLLLRIVSFGILYRSSTKREIEHAYDTCSHRDIHSIAIESPLLFAFKDAFFHNFFLQLPFSPSTDSPFCCWHSNFFLSLSIRGQFFLLVIWKVHSTFHWMFPKKAVLEKVIISVMGKFLCI